MKILLAGGAGYIGSHTLLALAEQNYELAVFDNFKNGHRRAVKQIESTKGKTIEIFEGELLNIDQINNALGHFRPDAVIHFAALIEAGVSVVHPTRFYENNVAGSLNLLKAMQFNNVRNIIFSSTAAVYGTPENPEVFETTELKPESAYGWSKLMVETILRDLNQKKVSIDERINHVILRYFNAAGADPKLRIGQDYPNPTHLITVAIEYALGLRDKFAIFGNDYPTKDGTCVRDYIHVSDLATAHVKALEYLVSTYKSDVFNIGTGTGYTNLEVVNELKKIHGDFDVRYGVRRPGDPVAFYANNEKAKTVLNWTPEFSLSDMIAHAYEWKKTYPKGYASMG